MPQVAGFVGTEPWLLETMPEAVAGLPVGPLTDAYLVTGPLDGLSGTQQQLFRINTWMPLPPAAVGFLTTPGWEEDIPLYEITGLMASRPFVFNAVGVEGRYVEPTIGQIWPR
jgi:hypothetical protein